MAITISSTDGITTPSIKIGSSGDAITSYDYGEYEARLYTSSSGVISSTDATYHESFNHMRYQRIGKMVHVQGTFRLTSKGSISGTTTYAMLKLPFPISESYAGSSSSAEGRRSVGVCKGTYDFMYLEGGSPSYAYFGNGSTEVNATDLNNTTYFNFSIMYETDQEVPNV